MTVSLTGFMGCGKSSVGRILASIKGWEFIDLDEYILAKTGKSPADLISRSEEEFRAHEAESLRDILVMRKMTGGNLVLALGGGTLATVPLQKLILEESTCVCLDASIGTCLKRISSIPASSGRDVCPDRPLLADAAKLYEKRKSVYALAPIQIDTEGKTPEECASEIAAVI